MRPLSSDPDVCYGFHSGSIKPCVAKQKVGITLTMNGVWFDQRLVKLLPHLN